MVTMAPGSPGLRRDRRRRRRHGLRRLLSPGAAWLAHAGAGALRHSPRDGVIARHHAHHPSRLLRAPVVRAFAAARLRAVGRAGTGKRTPSARGHRHHRRQRPGRDRLHRRARLLRTVWTRARGADVRRADGALSRLPTAARPPGAVPTPRRLPLAGALHQRPRRRSPRRRCGDPGSGGHRLGASGQWCTRQH